MIDQQVSISLPHRILSFTEVSNVRRILDADGCQYSVLVYGLLAALQVLITGENPKSRGSILEVPRTKITACCVLYLDLLTWGNYHMPVGIGLEHDIPQFPSCEHVSNMGYHSCMNLYMVVSQNRGISILTPKYHYP